MQQQGSLRLYGCGGAGINIATQYEKSSANPEPGYSVAHPVYIDTSRSNLTDALDPDRLAILEDTDGSGSVRAENHPAIAKSVKSLLSKHEPLDFNIVVFSASGGSGSVFGPLIVAELLARGLPVVAIVIGSDESTIRAKNTLNTVKSLEAIAERAELPVVMYYDHNGPDVKRSDVDRGALAMIGSLSVLASRQNRELDSKDLTYWLQFNKTTSVRPRLALLEVYDTNEEVEKLQHPLAIASLYSHSDDTVVAAHPEYQCTGYPTHQSEQFKCLHFVITVDDVQTIAKTMNATMAEHTTHRNARVDHNSLVAQSDKLTADGLIL